MAEHHRIPIKLSRDELIELRKFCTIKEISQIYKVSKNTIERWSKKLKVHNPPNPKINQKFFNKWSHDMAYILGFITADGNISKNEPYLKIELQRTDKNVLEYIKNHLNPYTSIYDRKHYDKRRKKVYLSCVIQFYSHQLVKQLKKYSIFPNKTGKHKLNFKIPKKYIGDYIRGYFDADGSSFLVKGNRVNTNICCLSIPFLKKLRKLSGNLGYLCLNGITPIWQMTMKDSWKLYKLIYNDNFHLQRKRDVFLKSNKLRNYKHISLENL